MTRAARHRSAGFAHARHQGSSVQFLPAPGDRAYILARVRHFVEQAARALVEISADWRGLLERGDDGRSYDAYVVAMPDGGWVVHRELQVFEHPTSRPGTASSGGQIEPPTPRGGRDHPKQAARVS